MLWHDHDLQGVEAVIVPGGFSYGDYLRAGALARFSPLMAEVGSFAAHGGLVLGICNGFQVLCGRACCPAPCFPTSLRFVCRQVDIDVVNPATKWTAACERGQRLSMPAKHRTGRYWAPDPVLDELSQRPGRAALRDRQRVQRLRARHRRGQQRAGNVVGLMPHPEHAVDPLTGSADGLRLFESAALAAAHATHVVGGRA